MSNGVKQGGVLSAILFTLYLDKLLIRLKNSIVGCSINGCYTGALSYDDDITLLCPSIRGLTLTCPGVGKKVPPLRIISIESFFLTI